MPDIKLIAAIDNKLGLAKKDKLPWDLPSDRRSFREHIEEGPVVMGWNTFEVNNLKPYGHGKNFVLCRQDKDTEGVELVHDAQEFFSGLKSDIWVAGGGQVFKEALPYATHLYLTRIEGDFNCDVFFPEFEKYFVLEDQQPIMTENGINFRYELWKRAS